MMFRANDYVVYGRMGVCRVSGIEQHDGKNFYALEAMQQRCRVLAPVDGKVPIRAIITKEDADAMIDHIPTLTVTPASGTNTRELTELYRSAILSNDCQKLLELTMSIYEKRKNASAVNKKLSGTDERFWREGEALLFGELSYALGIPAEDVKGYISSRVKAAKPGARK